MERQLGILKALSDRNRLRIVAALGRHDELCACQITELLQVTGATASRHLGVLQHAGLVESRKEGRWVHYRLAPPADARAVFQWLEKSFAESERLQADFQALEKIVEMGREDLCRMQRGEVCCPKWLEGEAPAEPRKSTARTEPRPPSSGKNCWDRT